MLKKLPLIIPLLALIALLVWWFTPRYSEEEMAWYRSVFCVIDHRDSQAFLRDMENIVEGGNADYALRKTTISRHLANVCVRPGCSSANKNKRVLVRISSAAAS